MEEKKVDRRVRKTKRQLRLALTKLLQEKPIKDITVREIADMIDINRGRSTCIIRMYTICSSRWRRKCSRNSIRF